MEPIVLYSIVLSISILGSFIGTITAGAGLIIVPSLLLLGIPPHVALGTMKLGGVGFRLGSLHNFIKHKKVIWTLILPLSILGMAGSAIGAQLLVSIEKDFFEKLIGIILIVLLPLIFLKKDVGTVHKTISKAQRYLAHLYYFISKIWSGFFSPGSGFINLFIFTRAYGLTILEAKGTTRIPLLISETVALIIFWFAGIVDVKIGIVLVIGMFVGSYVGSHVAIHKGDLWIKPLMGVTIVIASIKMIFF